MRYDPYRSARRRMRRGWRDHNEGFPVMLFGPEESLTVVVVSAVGRWLFRHRSALVPFGLALVALVAAAVAHARHAGWWAPVAALTLTGTLLIGFPVGVLHPYRVGRIIGDTLTRIRRVLGVGRAPERAYAAVVVAVSGGWLSAGIAIGPTVKPLPAVWLVATVMLGIPWWVHRRRRARVRVERTIAAWPTVSENMGLPGSRMTATVVDAWGWTARVLLRRGTTVAHAIERIPAIESGLGLRPGSVRVLPDPVRADRLSVRVIEKDPHAQPIRWPGVESASITRPVTLGLFEDGTPVRVLMLRRNMLIGGMVGSGKSGIVNVILAFLAACSDVVIWGVDLKGGMELQPWASCLDRLATTPADATVLFRDATRILDRRAARMTASGARVWEPTPDDPALVIVVDEYAEMPEDAHEHADSLARRGRAVAVNLLAATQRPTQDAMGGKAVRGQMDIRICLRVRERRDVDLILGQGMYVSGWHAHTLTQPGVFLLSDPEHPNPDRARAYLIQDGPITAHADRCAPDRPTLGPAHGSGVGSAGSTDRSDDPSTAPGRPQNGATPRFGVLGEEPDSGPPNGPETALWVVLRDAGSGGAGVAELMAATGMSHATLYRRLQAYARAGRVTRTTRGRWRAVSGAHGAHGDGPLIRPARGPRRNRTRPPGRDGQ